MPATSRLGLLLALGIVIAWLLTLGSLLVTAPGQLPWAVVVAAVLLRTLLQTGLFIVAHDCMHGVLLPAAPRWNHRFGAVLLALYAALPYASCWANHRRHHRFTASARDPDFHDDPPGGPLAWYRHFMASYLSIPQMGCLLGGWALLAVLAMAATAAAWLNLLLYVILPLLLSSLQLFVVGTYWPHRRQRGPQGDRHASSLDLPVWLSLLACYHFGYHRVHHDWPQLPWFALPSAHRRGRSLALT